MQTGTGLGLAIVNSIVRSKSVDGKVDVWSAEGVGTEIKITFTAEVVDDPDTHSIDGELMKLYEALGTPSISLAGFDAQHRGVQLLKGVLSSYLVKRWHLSLADHSQRSDIVIVNEDYAHVIRAMEDKRTHLPFIILSSNRGDPKLMNVVSEYERHGGFCRVVYKPAGPYRLAAALKLCFHALNISSRNRNTSHDDLSTAVSTPSDQGDRDAGYVNASLLRRYSEESGQTRLPQVRPLIGPRAITAHPLTTWSHLSSTTEQDESQEANHRPMSPVLTQSPSSPTIAIGTGGTLLKSAAGTLRMPGSRPLRVLVIEDNAILRNLL